MGKVLTLDGVTFSYGRHPFILNQNISFSEGDFSALIGPNGSGKSTFLKLAADIIRPSSGVVLLQEKPITGLTARERALRIGYLPQMIDMNLPFTVREIVEMGYYPRRPGNASPHDDVLGITGLREKGNRRLMHLSGGEQRRVFIAMMLAQNAPVFLLDEPLANLDIKHQIDLLSLFRSLRKEHGLTIITALHDLNMAAAFDRIIAIRDGTVIASGAPREILTRDLIRDLYGIGTEHIEHIIPRFADP